MAIVNGAYIYQPVAVAYLNRVRLLKMGFSYEDIKKMKKTDYDYWLYISNLEERKLKQMSLIKKRR